MMTTTKKKAKARVCLVGPYYSPEQRYVIDHFLAMLTAEVSDVAIIYPPAEMEYADASSLEAHSQNLANMEDCHFVVAHLTPEAEFNIGVAHGLKKQVITFAPRTLTLPPRLLHAVQNHFTPERAVSPRVPFMLSGHVNLEFTHGLELVVKTVAEAIKLLAPVYTHPQSEYHEAYAVAQTMKERWRT